MVEGLLEIVKGAYAALLGKEITPVATNIEEKSVTGINIEELPKKILNSVIVPSL